MTTEKPSLWHFDRRVGIDVIVAFIALLAAGVGYVLHQDQRTTKLEQCQAFGEKTDERHDSEIRELKEDINTKLDRLESKIDRLVERRGEK